jgi:hypothetical protein
MMSSAELNERIEQLENLPLAVQTPEGPAVGAASAVGNIDIVASTGRQTLAGTLGADGAEKKIFYWGWYWRTVNFDRLIHLCFDESGEVGFCENNKWNYPGFTLSDADSKRLRELCEVAVTEKTAMAVQHVNNFMNSKRPDDWESQARFARAEVEETMKMLNRK